jgi:hypothetical protein
MPVPQEQALADPLEPLEELFRYLRTSAARDPVRDLLPYGPLLAGSETQGGDKC